MRKNIRRRSEQQWRELVRQQAGSGLSVQAFCRRERISVGSLYAWRSRLRRRAAKDPAVIVRPVGEPARRAEFIDLGALASNGLRCELRLELGGGMVVHLVRG